MDNGTSNISESKYSKYGVPSPSGGRRGLSRAKSGRKSERPRKREFGPKKQRREFRGAMIQRLSARHREAAQDLADKDETIAASVKLGDELEATDKVRAAAHHARVISALSNHRIVPNDEESRKAEEYNKSVIKANGAVGAQQRQRGARRR